MRGFAVIYRRELAGLFLAPLAWILLFLALLLNAGFFLAAIRSQGGEVNSSLTFVMAGTPFQLMVILLPPLLTMRMISEESRSGLLEFLLTAPVSDAAVVAGKALAASTFISIVWGTTFVYAGLVDVLGADPDWGQLFVQWLGATLFGTLFCCVGIVASALFSTPLIAAFLAVVANIAIFKVPVWLLQVVSSERVALVLRKYYAPAKLGDSFLTGALDSAHVVFFCAWIAVLLFLAVRIVESKRWLG